ncbi:MAG: hypothetical protein ACP5XB_00120 [Isosphaeraceae bacterium]
MVPDYYARLGVDPGAATAEIEAALRKQQPVWSMGTRNPKTRHTNQLYLDEVPALRRALLGDPDARASYDAELAAARLAQREEKLNELQRRIRLRAAKGGLTSSDRSLLREEAARLGLDEEVLDRLTRLIPSLAETVRADSDDPDVEPPADVLDPSTRRQIRGALDHLDRRDLYDALGLPRDTPASIIAARADEQRQRWMRKAQVTAEKTAWLEIISHAQSHLTSPKARARYDRTLMFEAEEKLDAVIAFAVKGISRLDPGTHGVLIEEAAALGIGSERADKLITRACRKLGVARELGLDSVAPRAAAPMVVGRAALGGAGVPSANGAYQQLRCRNCSGVTELSPVARRSGAARCRHCGASLKWECPVCHRSHWVDQSRCGCRFPLALREVLVHHFAAAQHAFRTHDLTAAREHLEQVQKYAPHHVGARNGLAKIKEQEVAIDRARMACELAHSGKRLVAARRALEDWRKLVGSTTAEIQEIWKELRTGLRQAEDYAAQARKRVRTDPSAARSLYRQSLDIAADLPDALAGLERCPPDAPSALEVVVLGDRVRLSWTPPSPDGLGPLTYVILRKRGGLPQHPGDGTRIAEVSTCEFDDRHLKAGETVSYAVLGKRGGVESLSAVAGGPAVYLPDVDDLRVKPREGEIELSWIPPHGVLEVRVVRKVGSPPDSPKDGDRIAATLDQALDVGLDHDQIYHYCIYAIYRAPDGKRYASPGVLTAAAPRSPLAPLAAPRLARSPRGEVRLDWNEPPRGTVRILRTPRPLSCAPGAQLSLAEAEQLGGDWIAVTGPDRAVDLDPPPAGACYYTPLLALGATLFVGHSTAPGHLADPSDLRATRSPGPGDDPNAIRVLLRWHWADGASSTRLAARQGSPPGGPDDPGSSVTVVSREDYDRQGSWTLSLPHSDTYAGNDVPHQPDGALAPVDQASLPRDRWYITAYSEVLVDGVSLFSAGVEPTATTAVPGPHPEVTVSYTLKRRWVPGRPWSLTLRTEPPGSEVPPMVVVANERAIPLSADDGEIVARLPACRDGATHPIRTRLNLSRLGVRAFPDPTLEPGSSPPFRLRHPEAGPTRA